MFTNLVESASHHKDFARKGRFFLYTLVGYALLFTCAGVASIYAYDAHLENQDLEMLVLVAPVEAPVETVERTTPARTSAPSPDRQNNLPQRTEAIAQIINSTVPPETISATPSKVPEIPKGPYTIGNRNIEGTGPYNPNLPVGPSGPSTGDVGPGKPPVNVEELGAPPKPETKRVPPVISKGPITGQAISKPNPAYPPLAARAGVQGTVNIQILVDEAGKVISAKAVSGHVLLRQAAEQAALRTRFSPTTLSGVPVKVSGTITFNFTLNQ